MKNTELLKQITEELRKIANNAETQGQTVVMPDGSEEKGITPGAYEISDLLGFIADMIEP